MHSSLAPQLKLRFLCLNLETKLLYPIKAGWRSLSEVSAHWGRLPSTHIVAAGLRGFAQQLQDGGSVDQLLEISERVVNDLAAAGTGSTDDAATARDCGSTVAVPGWPSLDATPGRGLP